MKIIYEDVCTLLKLNLYCIKTYVTSYRMSHMRYTICMTNFITTTKKIILFLFFVIKYSFSTLWIYGKLNGILLNKKKESSVESSFSVILYDHSNWPPVAFSMINNLLIFKYRNRLVINGIIWILIRSLQCNSPLYTIVTILYNVL